MSTEINAVRDKGDKSRVVITVSAVEGVIQEVSNFLMRESFGPTLSRFTPNKRSDPWRFSAKTSETPEKLKRRIINHLRNLGLYEE